MEVGTEVRLVGRVQSRIYEKKYEDGTVEEKVAYEVSIASLKTADKDEDIATELTETTEEVV